MQDSFKAMMLAGALGDALGAPHEFGRGGYTGILEFETRIPSRYHSKNLPVGAVTDDSEMAIVIWRCIEKLGKYDEETVLTGYLDWCNNHSVARGKNTTALMMGLKTIRGFHTRYNKVFNTDLLKSSAQSNGCLMRCGPLARLVCINKYDDIDFDEMNKAIKIDCYLTNPNETCYQAVSCYTSAVAMAVHEKSKDEIKKFMKDVALKTDIILLREAIMGAFADTHRDVSARPTKGWVLHSLHIALWAFFHCRNFTEGVRVITEAKGDTDTNACIYGYLAGAFEGLESIQIQQESNISKLLDGFWKIKDIGL